jgi:putative DNA primase/helicase
VRASPGWFGVTATNGGHPGDRRFAELEPEQRAEIARGWHDATETEAAVIFNSMSVENRWSVVNTLPGRDGSHRAEIARIAGAADPATNSAFDGLAPTPDLAALTELGLARRLVEEAKGRFRYAPEIRTWLVWDGARYAEDVTGEVHRLAKRVVDRLHAEARFANGRRDELIRAWLRFQTAARLRAIVELATTEPAVPVMMKELDADPWALNCANGVVDLRTGELRPHDPAELHTKLVPVDYEPAATAPVWQRFLGEVFAGDQTLMRFVQRFAGYSLTGDQGEQMFIFAHGSGSNGKSTMLGTLRRLTGEYGVQLDPAVLTLGHNEQHPTGLTDLRGARMVTTIETDAGKRLAEALVKMLTGGDPIRARRMRCDYFEFEPTHHIWFAANHLPAIRGTDLGIWRRIALVPFEVTFEGDRKDSDLPAKLEAEAQGILAWAVNGCLEWQRDGLQVPDRVKAATASYRTSQDHLGRFLEERCTVENTAYVSARDLRAAYETWCEEQGEKPWSAKAVGNELTDRGFDASMTGRGNDRVRTWLGLGLA